ncbi:unnamed protein product [Paramecium sonneborni]|uniref:HSF-type DNA-binding domain-containing protein n=1 Tax=Paramecium sonneborni TaxID=65129 RepID=A0A8S1R7E7_9CILI|nr:unnamed protein product [Paramecium sonneborni]
MYGFHKSRSDQKENEFIHPHFKKDQKNLLKKIKRKSGEHGDDYLALIELKPYRNQNISDKQIQQIVSKQQELEKVCKILIEQNNKILQCNQQLRNQLVQEKFNGNKKLQNLKDYFVGQQQLQDNCLEKDTFEELIQSDDEELLVPNIKKVKRDDSDITIEKMDQLYIQQPLMLTNSLIDNDGMIQLLNDQQLNELYFD